MKLYQRIKQQTNNQNGIKLSDFTTFLCQKISQEDPDLVIATKQIPIQKMNPDLTKIRDIDINPPIIITKNIKRQKKKDKKLEQKKPVSKFQYSQSFKMIVTLGRLSSSISLYDHQLKVRKTIIPSHCKQMEKDVAILSFAYCDRYQRIGCIINNIGITFWEGTDNFKTQKTISKSHGEKIYYLQLFNSWVTTDKNKIYFWDIKEQSVKDSIYKEDSIFINDICEIDHLRSICVSYTTTGDQKCLIIYQNYKQVSKLQLGNPGCHTLHFNKFTQTLIPIGYKNTLSIYEIDIETKDLNFISQLKGHTSILSCITNVENTSLIMTGDDIGTVRVWQLNYLRCLQVIKVAKWLKTISVKGQFFIYSDSRLNIMHMDEFINKKKQDLYGVYNFYLMDKSQIWIVTRKDIRAINLKNGQINKIYVVCGEEQEVSTALHLCNGILIGTSKGQIINYSFEGHKKWKILAHQNQITQLKIDKQNRFFISAGLDSNIYVWPQKTSHEQGARKQLLQNFNGKQVNVIELSQKYNILAMGCLQQNSLYIWDYQCLKLCQIIQLSGSPLFIKICQQYPLIIVSTTQQIIYFFKFTKKQLKIKLQLISIISNNKNLFLTNLNLNKIMSIQNNLDNQNSISHVNYFITYFYKSSNNLILSSGKGIISCYDISHIITQFFQQNQIYLKKQSTNINRPIKQNFYRQISKKNYGIFKVDQYISQNIINPILIWKKQIHKDQINSITIVQMSQKYISTICMDGYYKITKLLTGQTICSTNINYPLPIIWNICLENINQIRVSIHKAMIILESILNNYGQQLRLVQLKSIDISNFLQNMVNGKYNRSINTNLNNVKLLKEQYTPQDIRKIIPKESSLKNLEAYKRVQLMRQNTKDNNTPKQNSTPLLELNHQERQAIQDFLSPHYLPKLMNRNIEHDNKQNHISQYYQLLFQHKLSKTDNYPRKRKQYSIVGRQTAFDKKNQSLLDLTRINEIQKPVTDILKDINTKLSLYKRKHKIKHKATFG